MTNAEGNWLPQAAHDRLSRFSATGLRTSLLSVPGVFGVRSVGLDAVGDVMGCIVQYIGWTGGASYGFGMPPGVSGMIDFQPYVDALYHGYDTALARMMTEAETMGADGVVGVRLTRDRLDENSHEFVALGTAVRAESTTRPRVPFHAALPGQDIAKLMRSGWVPTRIAIGLAVESQYLDWTSAAQMSWGAGNTEVTGPTQLMTRVRAQARANFTQHAQSSSADGAIVSDMTLRSWHEEVNGARLLCAESTVFGTAISRFHAGRAAPTKALAVMPLR